MKRLTISFAVLTALTSFTSSVVQAQIAVSPASVEFHLQEGESQQSEPVAISNASETVRTMQVFWMDFDMDEKGEHSFLPFGSHPKSCKGRVDSTPQDLIVSPQGGASVKVTMRSGEESCWSILFINMVAVTVRPGLTMNQRVGVKVYGTQTRHVPDGAVSALVSDGKEVKLSVENFGERILRAQGRVEIRNSAGELLHTLPVKDWSVLPGRTRTLPVALPEPLPAGEYLAVAVLDYGREARIGKREKFLVP